MHPTVTDAQFPGPRRPDVVRRIAFWTALLLLLALTALMYQRGLHGVFLFDDFANLPALGAFGPVDNWTAFWRYITSGTADPTGRPLALLSFLIDAHDWPADPWPFKRTNLILHLINGALLALLLRRLGRLFRPTSPRRRGCRRGAWRRDVAASSAVRIDDAVCRTARGHAAGNVHAARPARAIAAAGIWPRRDSRLGPWLCAGAIGIATLLAVASKANGILLPLLTLLIEALLLAPSQPIADSLRTQLHLDATNRFGPSQRAPASVARIPRAALDPAGAISFRPWTLPQRLMTEARIVCEYLSLLWLPHPYTAGLFNDAVTVSTGLLAPPSTLASIVFLAGLFAAAVAAAPAHPALALACFSISPGNCWNQPLSRSNSTTSTATMFRQCSCSGHSPSG